MSMTWIDIQNEERERFVSEMFELAFGCSARPAKNEEEGDSTPRVFGYEEAFIKLKSMIKETVDEADEEYDIAYKTGTEKRNSVEHRILWKMKSLKPINMEMAETSQRKADYDPKIYGFGGLYVNNDHGLCNATWYCWAKGK